MEQYGKELILDIHDCNLTRFDRVMIESFMVRLCNLINMERENLHFWDYDGDYKAYQDAPDHLKGISAVQFIRTSNITIHTLDALKRVYLNIFSCKDFDSDLAGEFAADYFHGEIKSATEVKRV